MAESQDHDPESATEQATPKKLDQLREQGQLAKSAELTAVVSLTVGLVVVYTRIGPTSASVRALAAACFSLRGHTRPLAALASTGTSFVQVLVPVALVSCLAAVAAGLSQTRGYVSLSQLSRNISQLDPWAGLVRALPGPSSFIEIGKMALKVVGVGVVTFWVVEAALPQLLTLARFTMMRAVGEVGGILGSLVVRGVAALVALAVLDFVLVRRKFAQDARMSRKDLQDEQREEEGDPKIRGKRRARAAKLARQRAIDEVKKATVLVVNPTHVAVAIRYEPRIDAAPVVLAKGQDEVALRMREEARAHRVPIVEDRPLARAMLSGAKVGQAIPMELYEAVARVVAHVWQIRGITASAAGGAP